MDPLLNERPVWMTPTAEIQALHEKPIVIEKGDRKWLARLRVDPADQDGPDAGKCSVALWQASIKGGNEWTDVGSTILKPTGQSRSWKRYLSPEALKLIGQKTDGPRFGELYLVIPARSF